MNLGSLHHVSHDWDERGFTLRLEGDNGVAYGCVTDVESARLLAAVLVDAANALEERVADHDRAQAAYDRASPEEREMVLVHRVMEDALAADPEPYSVRADRLAEWADLKRKALRENPEAAA